AEQRSAWSPTLDEDRSGSRLSARAGLPAGAGRMLPQTLHVGPRDAPVLAAKESGRPAGSTPAYRAPCAGVTFQTLRIVGPASPYVRPAPDGVPASPRPWLRHTAGPNHSLSPPAYNVPVAGS